MECFETANLNTHSCIYIFEELFSRFGLSFEICIDNAVIFTSEEFQNFLQTCGIKHITGVPYHPVTNGLEEVP